MSVLLYALMLFVSVSDLTFLVMVAGIVLFQIALFSYVGLRGQGALTAPDETLDERQLALKNCIYRRSYYWLMWIACAMLVLNIFVSREMWTSVSVAFFILLLSLPAYLLMWLEPDPISDDATPGVEARSL